MGSGMGTGIGDRTDRGSGSGDRDRDQGSWLRTGRPLASRTRRSNAASMARARASGAMRAANGAISVSASARSAARRAASTCSRAASSSSAIQHRQPRSQRRPGVAARLLRGRPARSSSRTASSSTRSNVGGSVAGAHRRQPRDRAIEVRRQAVASCRRRRVRPESSDSCVTPTARRQSSNSSRMSASQNSIAHRAPPRPFRVVPLAVAIDPAERHRQRHALRRPARHLLERPARQCGSGGLRSFASGRSLALRQYSATSVIED